MYIAQPVAMAFFPIKFNQASFIEGHPMTISAILF